MAQLSQIPESPHPHVLRLAPLPGSFAMAYYTTPRMTRDLDIVVALKVSDVAPLSGQFSSDFYLDVELAA
jgi:hypothetical protein